MLLKKLSNAAGTDIFNLTTKSDFITLKAEVEEIATSPT